MAEIAILGSDGCDDEGEGGERGKRGKRGKRGRRGHRGHDGATGATGATGSTGASAIIPFASGEPVALVHVSSLLSSGGLIGFGSALDGVAVGTGLGTIDLTGGVGIPANMAFSMPRDGTLAQLSVYFSNVISVELPSDVSVIVQLYRSTSPNNIFSPIPGALVTLPLPVGVLAIGGHVSGTTPLAVAVSNQDRLLLVARVTALSFSTIAVTGYVSAGLAIA